MLAVVVRGLSKHQSAFLFDCCVFIARFTSLSCYSSAKTRIRPVKSYHPDGSVRKLKARFCARGDKQVEGIDYFNTFAPVINWTTVRLMLILTLILNLSTCQVDYRAAFVHLPIDRDPNWENMSQQERDRSGIYLEMPRGFAEQGKVLKLRRSLYGLKQSPRNFFQHLKGKLEAVGLHSQDHVDPCLFMSDKVIVLVYVDDTLFYSP